MPASEVEERGLLHEEEFDIDELDYQNGGPKPVEAFDRTGRRSRRSKWLNRRFVCLGLALVVVLLLAGIGLNKGGDFKIPKLYTPTSHDSSTETKPLPDSEKDTGSSWSGPPGHIESPSPALAPETPTPPSQPEFPAKPSSPTGAEESEEPTRPSSSSGHDSPSTAKADAASTHAIGPSSLPAASKETGLASPNSNVTEGGLLGTQNLPGKNWGKEKPKGFKIIGLIFYGRPSTVAVLDCYLQKNLVRNGGWLDAVHFVVNTGKRADLKWLDKLVKRVEEYKRIDLTDVELGRSGYNAGWATVERDDMYIKIDDDIVYFDDNAIQSIVYTKLKHPESLNVVATLINSPETGWLHYRMGAIHAYLPDTNRPKDGLIDFESYGPTAWRASALPEWTGQEMSFPLAGVRKGKEDDGSGLPADVPGAPPFKGHRWLPLPEGDKYLWRTPMAEAKYDADGPDWLYWSIGAQAHYSFLQNLEEGELQRYHYGSSDDPEWERVWDMAYDRMNINFMAMWGRDVLDNLPFESSDDELALSVQVTRKLHRPLLVNTKAIAAHFSFRSQVEMYDTDLLDRYRAYANEMICAKDNQIKTS